MSGSTGRLASGSVDALADYLEAATAGARPPVYTNYGLSHDPTRKLGVMRVVDFPRGGLMTAISFGLCHESFGRSGFPDRIELLMTWDRPIPAFEKVLVVVAETIIMRGRNPKPGAIYLDACKIANVPGLGGVMPHALIMFPLLGRDELIEATLPDAKVWFLQVVPIYEKEKDFIETKGFKTFEALLSHDVMNLHAMDRASHVR